MKDPQEEPGIYESLFMLVFCIIGGAFSGGFLLDARHIGEAVFFGFFTISCLLVVKFSWENLCNIWDSKHEKQSENG